MSFRTTALAVTLVALAACSTPPVSPDYDATRDFAAYHTWAWQTPAVRYRPDDPRVESDLTGQRIRSAVETQLDQRGLRAAPANVQADLKVQAWLIVEDRQEEVATNYGGPWGGYWGGPGYSETRTLDYKVGTLQLDFFDGKDGKLVWRASSEQVLRTTPQNPAEREAAIRKIVTRLLTQYPPRR
ncbi:DUF4136 domain-containing protein [Pseudomonas sp. RIT-PI-AD]|uniref:DUF4136 domain-containing protein n=1 Tax=Pseudomonas sp. RIT-PI-AD TaxID=3035294 RepID=UPI0021D86AE6|nr:DUF4136 domain-containing protein [Pseudomonas sp. RIT-PI-AD]